MQSSLPVAPGGKLELVGADITQKATLLPEYFAGVRAVVSCTAVKVAPKEADVDRAKYFQVWSKGPVVGILLQDQRAHTCPGPAA